MNTTLKSISTIIARKAALLLTLLVSLAAIACESHSVAGGPAAIFPDGSVTVEDVKKLLEFDARVEGHEIDGNKLIVDVNQSWKSSPPGLHERSLGKWFGLWQAANGGSAREQKKGYDVVARFDGKDVAHWSADGYKWLEEPKGEQAKSE